MVKATDWRPAKRIARTIFPRIGRRQSLDFEDSPKLWNGEVVHASSPANLLHEVAHFQLAPEWRRHTHAYGLGIEPEGGNARTAPLLVSASRAFKEEALASALGIWWEIYLDYENWSKTAEEHSWLVTLKTDPMELGPWHRGPETSQEFREVTGAVTDELLSLGVLGPDLTPRPILAPPWRHTSFKHGL